MKFLTAALAALTISPLTFASDPPVAPYSTPPVAVYTEPPVAPLPKAAEPFAACVEVWQSQPDATGARGGGSGTCVRNESGKSLVLTNNHVVSPGQGPDGQFVVQTGQRVDVKYKGKTYAGVVVAADGDLDAAAIVVDAELPAAPLAEGDVRAGTVVVRNGIGSGKQTLTVIPSDPKFVTARMRFVARGVSESGDSGSAYFDADGRVVALHCGKDSDRADANPRGTPVGPIRAWLRAKVGRLDAPAPAVIPPVPPKAALPQSAPLTYRAVTYRDGRGRLFTVYELTGPNVFAPCPTGRCPLR